MRLSLAGVAALVLAIGACSDSTGPLSKTSRLARIDDCPTFRANLTLSKGTVASIDCGNPPGGGGSGTSPQPSVGIALGVSMSDCLFGTPDSDADGVSDYCEYVIAREFAPVLHVYDNERQGEPYIPGEYYYGVKRHSLVDNTTTIRVIYFPAYFFDNGNRIAGDAFCGYWPFPACDDGHSGDSEHIVIDVLYDANANVWMTRDVFLSAHCGSSYDDSWCRWYSWEQFAYHPRPRAAPHIWVASWKHANYRSREDCGNGAMSTDSCDDPSGSFRFPVDIGFNIQSHTNRLAPQRVRRAHNASYDPDKFEDLWGSGFSGWQYSGGTSGHASKLTTFGFLPPEGGVPSGGHPVCHTPCYTDTQSLVLPGIKGK